MSDPNNNYIEIRDQNPEVVGNVIPDSATTKASSTREDTPTPVSFRGRDRRPLSGPKILNFLAGDPKEPKAVDMDNPDKEIQEKDEGSKENPIDIVYKDDVKPALKSVEDLIDAGAVKKYDVNTVAKARGEKPSEVIDEALTLRGPRKRIHRFFNNLDKKVEKMFIPTDDPPDIGSLSDDSNPGKIGIAHHADDYDSDGYHKKKKRKKDDRRRRVKWR